MQKLQVNLFLNLPMKQDASEKITAKGEIIYDESIYDGKKSITRQQVGKS